MFRRFLAVVGNVPGILLVVAGPLIGMFQGNLRYPDILLSHMMEVPSYKSVFGLTFCTVPAISAYLWMEAFRYTRARSPPELHWAYDVMISLVVFGMFPGMLGIVFFPLEDHWGFDCIMHCLSAAVVFLSVAGLGFIYSNFCAPVLTKLQVVPKEDAWYRRWAAAAVCLICVVGAVVRPFHIADPMGWSWALLAVEVLFAAVGLFANIFCTWRTLAIMDREEPVAFAAVPDSKQEARPAAAQHALRHSTFRQVLCVLGNVPGILLVVAGPFIGVLQGNLRYPDVLLSHMMEVPSYKAIFGLIFCTIAPVSAFVWTEAFRYTRARSPPELHRAHDVMISLMVFGFWPGMLSIVFFPLEDHWGFDCIMHCLGAAVVFLSVAGVGFIINLCAPVLTKLEVVPKEDAWYRRGAAGAVCLLCVIGAAVRSFHLANPMGWSWALLAVEVLFSSVGFLANIFGTWRTLAIMDKEAPLAFGAVRVTKQE